MSRVATQFLPPTLPSPPPGFLPTNKSLLVVESPAGNVLTPNAKHQSITETFNTLKCLDYRGKQGSNRKAFLVDYGDFII